MIDSKDRMAIELTSRDGTTRFMLARWKLRDKPAELWMGMFTAVALCGCSCDGPSIVLCDRHVGAAWYRLVDTVRPNGPRRPIH